MSGYPALRSPEDNNPNGSGYGVFGHRDDESDGPVVLARVADFTAKPEHVCEEPLDASLDDIPDPFPEERPAFALDYCSVARSRLAVGGLVLVAGLCGFLLGRVTSPTVRDPDQWRPAPSATEAPEWNSEAVATSEISPIKQESPVQRETPVATPWNMPTANVPPETMTTSISKSDQSASQPKAVTAERPSWPPASHQPESYGQSSPWPRQDSSPTNTGLQSRWAANQHMSLPAGQSASQSNQRPIENVPYTDARLARRPMPPNQTNTPPEARRPVQMPKEYPIGSSNWAPEKAATPCHGGPTGYSAGTVNQNGNSSTGYPPRQNTTNTAPTNVPVQGATGQNNYPYNYPYNN